MKTTSQLRYKLTIPLFAIIFIVGSIATFQIYRLFSNELNQQFRNQAILLLNSISYAVYSSSEQPDLQRHIMALGGEKQINEIIIASGTTDKIIASTKTKWLGQKLESASGRANTDKSSTRQLDLLLGKNNDLEEIHHDHASHHFIRRIYLPNSDINKGELDKAFILVNLNTNEINKTFTTSNSSLLTWLASLFVILLFAISFLIQEFILRPAKNINSTLVERAKGNQSIYATIFSNDELGQLAKTLNNTFDAIKAAEKDADENYARYAGIIDSAMDGILVSDEKGTIIFANKEIESIFGYSSNDLTGKPINILIPQQYHEKHVHHIEQFIDSDVSGKRMLARGDIYGLDSNKKTVPLEISISKTIQNNQVLLTAIIRDITEKKKTENELRRSKDELEERIKERTEILNDLIRQLSQSEERLNEAQHLALIGNWELDIANDKLSWSDEVFNITGLDKNTQPSLELFLTAVHPDDRVVVKHTYDDVFETKAKSEFTHRLLMKNGDIKFVLQKYHPEYINNDTSPIRIRGVIQDITTQINTMDKLHRSQENLRTLNDTLEERVEERTKELNVAKESAEKANRSKSIFLSRMSHELRTPLNGILGFNQLLEMSKMSEKQASYTDEITRAGTHLLNMINDLLDLSRVETQHLNVLISKINVTNTINSAISLVDAQLKNKNITLTTSYDGFENTAIYADETRFKQIITNLLTNAVKYNRSGGQINISLENKTVNKLRVYVKDNGLGISAQNILKIFIPFERLDAERGDEDGAGIGLALSKSLAELMSGEIGVESELGRGSTFWVEFPITNDTEPDKLSENKSTKNQLNHALSILYVEDNPANLRLVKIALSAENNIKFISATNGTDGLKLIEKHKPDIILLDINLPGLSGYEILEKIRAKKEFLTTPVIALSADAMPYDTERGLKAGFNRYITKPLNLDELSKAINELSGNLSSTTSAD